MAPTIATLNEALAGRYSLEREIGAGGMATVYLAHDLRHDRRVALKVLRPELAAVIGAERFLREIRTTANLQHPHILPLFDSGEAGSQLFYVMPLVEGESLRDRLDHERQLGVEESVRIASEVAAALDYAHRHGVVHRDVKPANILLHDGSALVTDFGIALAIRNAGADRITETGLSLGTPHYMSPEQATGDRDIGARSDIYSLAAVLYEMLAGEPPHSGGTIQAVIAKVLTESARPLGDLRSSVPVHVALAVEQALSKVPADRFATAAAFAEALRNTGITSSRATLSVATRSGAAVRRSSPAQLGMIAAGALAVGGLLGWAIRRPEPASPPRVVRFEIRTDSLTIDDRPVLSPDGSLIVYSLRGAGGSSLFVRRLDELEGRQLPGTEGGYRPFFAPDGQSIGFVTNDQLRILRLDGGAPTNVTRISTYFLGGTWAPDNTIYFTQWPRTGLYRVNTSGGATEKLELGIDSIISPLSPRVLPGGRAILLSLLTNDGPVNAVYNLQSRRARVLGPGVQPEFVEPSWMVFANVDGQLYRQAFDPVRLDTIAAREAIATNVKYDSQILTSFFSTSSDGTLASIMSGSTFSDLALVDRTGRQRVLLSANHVWAPRFSPDGKRLAYGAVAPDNDRGGDQSDLWLYDLASGANQRLTYDGNDSNDPEWSGDGRSLLFSSIRDSLEKELFVLALDGASQPRRVLSRRGLQWDSDWSHDGKYIVFTDVAPDSTGWNIWSMRLDDSTSARPFLVTPFQETGARLSPDGRWITYYSNETGRNEVYVQSFPEPSQKTVISIVGGRDPMWHHGGRAIYYWQGDQLMHATLAIDRTVSLVKREPVFRYGSYATGAHANYDVSPDGQSFVIVSGGSVANRLSVALNLIR